MTGSIAVWWHVGRHGNGEFNVSDPQATGSEPSHCAWLDHI